MTRRKRTYFQHLGVAARAACRLSVCRLQLNNVSTGVLLLSGFFRKVTLTLTGSQTQTDSQSVGSPSSRVLDNAREANAVISE